MDKHRELFCTSVRNYVGIESEEKNKYRYMYEWIKLLQNQNKYNNVYELHYIRKIILKRKEKKEYLIYCIQASVI